MIVFFLALIIALTALATTGKNKKIGRAKYSLIVLLIWLPLIALGVLDLINLYGSVKSFNLKNILSYLGWYFLVTSYPLYFNTAKRLNDAGMGRFWGYLALIPYINFFVFISICIAPSATEQKNLEGDESDR